jgi:hypothetical protein
MKEDAEGLQDVELPVELERRVVDERQRQLVGAQVQVEGLPAREDDEQELGGRAKLKLNVK